MNPKPFRPAREIAITARRTACHDPANYDSTSNLSSTMDRSAHKTPPGDRLTSPPGRPTWWPTFTKTMAGIAGAGALLFLAGLHPIGAAITAGSAAAWGLARIAAFYDNDLP